ncbi:MAG: DUF4340 domain-containing protein [Saprospiraceae bacterium]
MNKVLIIILLLLGGTAIWYFSAQTTNTYGIGEDAFSIKNTKKIHKIFLGDKAGNTATLTKENGTWIYNGKYKAREKAVETLLETVQKMEILMVPGKNAEAGMLKGISLNGVLARFYDENGKKLMGYQIGGVSTDGQGTNILMEGEKQPYIVHIPIWEGHLTPRYLITEKDWRDRAVFEENYKDIKAVSIEYPQQKTHSFKLDKEGGKFKVEPFYQTTSRINQELKQGKVQQYLISFKRIVSEAFKNDSELKTGILKQTPFAIVTLEKNDGTVKKVTFYPINDTFATDGPPINGVSTEKYFATSGDDFLLVQHASFGKIFWGYGSFFLK